MVRRVGNISIACVKFISRRLSKSLHLKNAPLLLALAFALEGHVDGGRHTGYNNSISICLKDELTHLEEFAQQNLHYVPGSTMSIEGNSMVLDGQLTKEISRLLDKGVSIKLAAKTSITVNSEIISSGSNVKLTFDAPLVVLNYPLSLQNSTALKGKNVLRAHIGPCGRIQNGVDIVSQGGVVRLSEAVYSGQVNINGKNVTLKGQGIGKTVVKCSGALPLKFACNPMIAIQNTSNVVVKHLTIDGNYCGLPSNVNIVGVAFQNAGGMVADVHVTRLANRPPPFGNSPQGVGLVGQVNTGKPFAINVYNSTFDLFGGEAISFKGEGLAVNVDNNVVRGLGTPSGYCSNGIHISCGATGIVSNCTVKGIHFDRSTGAGILLEQAGPNLIITSNIVDGNDEGIVSRNSADNLLIHNNSCKSNLDAGIHVEGTKGLSQLIANSVSNHIKSFDAEKTPGVGMYLSGNAGELFEIAANTFYGDPDDTLLVNAHHVIMEGNTFLDL